MHVVQRYASVPPTALVTCKAAAIAPAPPSPPSPRPLAVTRGFAATRDGSIVPPDLRSGSGASSSSAAGSTGAGSPAGTAALVPAAAFEDKVSSLQMFVNAETDCEEQGPASFPVHQVHKIAQVPPSHSRLRTLLPGARSHLIVGAFASPSGRRQCPRTAHPVKGCLVQCQAAESVPRACGEPCACSECVGAGTGAVPCVQQLRAALGVHPAWPSNARREVRLASAAAAVVRAPRMVCCLPKVSWLC